MIARAAMGLIGLAALVGTAHAQGKSTGAVLPGGDTKQPIAIEAAKLDYFEKEQKLIYTGSVVATQGASKLKASVLTIFLAPKNAGAKGAASGGGGSTNQVQRMLAAGPVTMVQRDQVGTGDNGVYDKAANTVVLTGNVVLTQGDNVTKGDKLVYDLKSGHATVSAQPGRPVIGLFNTGSEKTASSSGGGEPAAGSAPEGRRPGRKPSH